MGTKSAFSLKRIKILLGIAITALTLYAIWTSNPVEDSIGRVMDFVDPKRNQHVKEVLTNKTDKDLLKYLHHGDHVKHAVAASLLAKRATPDLFDEIEMKLNHHAKDIRMAARRILPHIDSDKSCQVFEAQLKKTQVESADYRDTLLIMSSLKCGQTFEYLIEYAEGDVGNQHASSEMLRRFGDARGIPILKKRLAEDSALDDFERERVKKAIKHLEA